MARGGGEAATELVAAGGVHAAAALLASGEGEAAADAAALLASAAATSRLATRAALAAATPALVALLDGGAPLTACHAIDVLDAALAGGDGRAAARALARSGGLAALLDALTGPQGLAVRAATVLADLAAASPPAAAAVRAAATPRHVVAAARARALAPLAAALFAPDGSTDAAGLALLVAARCVPAVLAAGGFAAAAVVRAAAGDAGAALLANAPDAPAAALAAASLLVAAPPVAAALTRPGALNAVVGDAMRESAAAVRDDATPRPATDALLAIVAATPPLAAVSALPALPPPSPDPRPPTGDLVFVCGSSRVAAPAAPLAAASAAVAATLARLGAAAAARAAVVLPDAGLGEARAAQVFENIVVPFAAHGARIPPDGAIPAYALATALAMPDLQAAALAAARPALATDEGCAAAVRGAATGAARPPPRDPLLVAAATATLDRLPELATGDRLARLVAEAGPALAPALAAAAAARVHGAGAPRLMTSPSADEGNGATTNPSLGGLGDALVSWVARRVSGLSVDGGASEADSSSPSSSPPPLPPPTASVTVTVANAAPAAKAEIGPASPARLSALDRLSDALAF